ncbi:thiamine phosphate synthase [Martelella sp. AD-3]|uniref:thiamine phosphate synthase n=1 Tax=Martelella sp. AD-3 TaxID=686597 RepID=UPI000467AA4A|nr:thiamine phosphate synthase [Martelella sp. AD-3]AMM85464.1 thiamine-phosphate pyrophosphorylase [Martelella sp. AD-3]MAM13751.1 thiamine phosphate synthase [Rhizobiaceae bacterium]
MDTEQDRCRLVLIAPEIADMKTQEKAIADALRGGDVASVILPQYGETAEAFQKRAELIVPMIQNYEAAAIIAGDTRVAGRAKADGIHVEGGTEALADAMDRFSPRMIVGGSGPKDRHHALELGELNPDYVFFGKLDGDTHPQTHPKNLELGEWWASMVEIPCIVMAGSEPASVIEAALTWAEFVAVGKAVFAAPGGPAGMVAQINAALDEKAPRFDY